MSHTAKNFDGLEKVRPRAISNAGVVEIYAYNRIALLTIMYVNREVIPFTISNDESTRLKQL